MRAYMYLYVYVCVFVISTDSAVSLGGIVHVGKSA